MHRESGPVVDLVALAVTTHGFPPRVAADIADVRSGFFGVHAASIARLAFSISLYFMVGSGPAARRLAPPDARVSPEHRLHGLAPVAVRPYTRRL